VLQPLKAPLTLIEYNDRRKKDRNKIQGNKAPKTQGSRGKQNHQGRETRDVGIETPLHLQRAMTPIPATMDQTRDEEEEVTWAGGQTEKTLLTHKS